MWPLILRRPQEECQNETCSDAPCTGQLTWDDAVLTSIPVEQQSALVLAGAGAVDDQETQQQVQQVEEQLQVQQEQVALQADQQPIQTKQEQLAPGQPNSDTCLEQQQSVELAHPPHLKLLLGFVPAEHNHCR